MSRVHLSPVNSYMPIHFSRRRSLVLMFGSIFSVACAAKSKTVTLDVVLFSYLSRSIYDVHLGPRSIGVAGKYPRSGRGAVSGVELALGRHEANWRLDGPEGLADNGATIRSVNQVVIDEVPPDAKYVGVHIYPDYTVELVYSRHFPRLSKRGEAFDLEWRRSHGK